MVCSRHLGFRQIPPQRFRARRNWLIALIAALIIAAIGLNAVHTHSANTPSARQSIGATASGRYSHAYAMHWSRAGYIADRPDFAARTVTIRRLAP